MLHRGHPFLPNKKPESGLSIRSVKRFSRTSEKVSIELANETENRLLKSGKDSGSFITCFSSSSFCELLKKNLKKLKKYWTK